MAIFQTNNMSLFLFSCSWFLYLILISSSLLIFYAFFIFCPPLTLPLFSHSSFFFFFFLHFYPFPSTLIISHFSSCPILASCLRHIFPRFHTISHPFLPPQAVWDVSCVCRPAGPDPRMLQRERWKNPQLLQHSSPLPAVCQQQQTGVHLMN